MKPEEKTVFITLRNQILGIAIATCLGGLGMNTLFMFTINDTVTDLRNENAVLRTEMREQDNTHTAKIEELQKLVYTK